MDRVKAVPGIRLVDHGSGLPSGKPHDGLIDRSRPILDLLK